MIEMTEHKARAIIGTIGRGGFVMKDMYLKHDQLRGTAFVTYNFERIEMFFEAAILEVCEPDTPVDIIGLLARVNDKVRDAVLLGFFFAYMWDSETDEPTELGRKFPEIYPGEQS